MPELPDVEILERCFDKTSLRQRIVDIRFPAPRIVRGGSPRTLSAKVRGSEFISSCRRGKYLLAELSAGGWLSFHFGMDGSLEFKCGTEHPGKSARAVVHFESGCRLIYHSWRMLGGIGWTESPDCFFEEHGIGPDALDPKFDLSGFKKAVSGKKSPVKPVLMDQHVLAGIGNIYADEILFQARIHPATPFSKLGDAQIKILFLAIKRVLQTAIQRQADIHAFPRNYLLPHRSPNGRCPVCGTQLERITLAGRTTYLCPTHQQFGRAAQ